MESWLIQITNYLLTQSWQIAVLTMAVVLVSFLLRNRSAHVRYLLWLIVLAKCLVPPLYSVPIAVLPQKESAANVPAPPVVDRMVSDYKQPETPMTKSAGTASVDSEGASLPQVTISPAGYDTRAWLAIGWILGVVALSFYYLINALRTQIWLQKKRKALPGEFLANINNLILEHGVRHMPHIWILDRINQPFVWGLLHGSIYLPAKMLDGRHAKFQASLLGHELSHIMRLDAMINLLQVIAQTVFWFHPFVWWVNRKIRAEREKCCDEMTIARLNAMPEEYSEAIVETLAAKYEQARPVPSLAVAGQVKNIEERINTMLKPGKKFYKHSSLPVAAVVILTAVLAVPATMVLTVKAASKPTTEHDAETALAVAPIPIQTPTFRKIWNLRGYDAQLSPDGKSIVLAPVGTGKLCIIPRDGTVRPDDPNISQFFVNTAEIKVDSGGLAWSGNGRWIAFNGGLVPDGKREGNTRMYVVSAQGGKPKEVYDAYLSGLIHLPRKSLSPDGKTLAFPAQDANEMHVYTIPLEGGMPKRLVEVPARDPVFSPDGRMIAYVEDKNAGLDGGALWVVPVGGGTPRRIADAKNAWSPVWSPDGRMIAFFDRGGDRQICIIPVNERGEPAGEKATIDRPKETGILWRLTGWTPDNKIGIICSNPGSVGLYTLSPNGGPATLVTHTGTGSIFQPRWSPDSKRIIYVKWPCEDGSNWLYEGLASITAEGGEVTMIPIESDTKILITDWRGGGSVSPDGKTIVFAGCKAQEAEARTMYLWTLPIEGGRATQLTNAAPPLTDSYPCWSPDGKAIAFVRSRSQNIAKMFTKVDIYIIPSTGGEPRQLTSESDRVFFSSIAWSPDGKLLAYHSSQDAGETLRVIPAKGGESRVVAKLRPMHLPNELAWSSDSRRVALNDGGIQIISLDDGRVADIDPGVTTTQLRGLDWSRDGARLVFTGYQGGGNGFWLMENFLPVGMDMKKSK